MSYTYVKTNREIINLNLLDLKVFFSKNLFITLCPLFLLILKFLILGSSPITLYFFFSKISIKEPYPDPKSRISSFLLSLVKFNICLKK